MSRLLAIAAVVAPFLIGVDRAAGQCPPPQQVLERPAGGYSSEFADAIAASGEWLAVGDPKARVGAYLRGAVYMYRRVGVEWELRQRIDAVGDVKNFGERVAITEDALIIATADAHPIERGGKVFFYNLLGSEWQFDSEHTAPIRSGGEDYFGGSLDVRGDLAIIGAGYADIYGFRRGATFVYHRDASGRWSYEGNITPRAAREEGWRALGGIFLEPRGAEARVLVGLASPVYGDPGAMALFERRGGAWEEVLTWEGGASIASGGWLAVARDERVELYRDEGHDFVLADVVGRERPLPWRRPLGHRLAFGRSSGLSPEDPPDLLLVQDSFYETTSFQRGRAILYRRTGQTWAFAASLGYQGSGVGNRVALSSHEREPAVALVRSWGSLGSFPLDTLCGDCPREHEPAGEVTLTMRAGGDLTPSNPSTSLEVLAWFPSSDAALAAVEFDVEASEAALSDPVLHLPAGGTTAGSVSPDLTSVRRISASQFMHWRYGVEDYSNPVVLWSGVFTTEDFRPRDISLRAVASDFSVYPVDLSPETTSRLDDYVETVGALRVRQTADCDGSGALDFMDFLCFQQRFAAGDPRADFDADGEITFFDFLAFQDAFAGGCP